MQDISEVIKSRRSIRKFKSDAIPEEVLSKILEAGTYAPTGKNMQSPIIVCVTDKKVRDELSALNCEIGGWSKEFDPFYGAPVVAIVLAEKSWRTRVYDGSVGLFVSAMASENALTPGDLDALRRIVREAEEKAADGEEKRDV